MVVQEHLTKTTEASSKKTGRIEEDIRFAYASKTHLQKQPRYSGKQIVTNNFNFTKKEAKTKHWLLVNIIFKIQFIHEHNPLTLFIYNDLLDSCLVGS